jgi:hypothetical protein
MSTVQKYYKIYNKYITKQIKENVHQIHTHGKKVKTLKWGYVCNYNTPLVSKKGLHTKISSGQIKKISGQWIIA